MRRMVVGAILALVVIGSGAQGTAQTRQAVEVRFVHSAIADYLLYLFHRGTGGGRFKGVATEFPLADVPVLEDTLVSLPGAAASAGVRRYEQLQPLLERYRTARERVVEIDTPQGPRYSILAYSLQLPDFTVLDDIVRRGAPHYTRFEEYWAREIAPAERAKLAEWERQLETARPLEHLERLTRLRFPSPTLDIVAIGLHGSGSANTYPAAIYTGLGVRNVAWAVGHEGTHLVIDRYAGARWFDRPRAPEAIRRMESAGGHAYDIEEALCLLMQVKLSEAGGLTEPGLRMSERLAEPSPKRRVLAALEQGWDAYLRRADTDIVDYMLDRTIVALAGSTATPYDD